MDGFTNVGLKCLFMKKYSKVPITPEVRAVKVKPTIRKIRMFFVKLKIINTPNQLFLLILSDKIEMISKWKNDS